LDIKRLKLEFYKNNLIPKRDTVVSKQTLLGLDNISLVLE